MSGSLRADIESKKLQTSKPASLEHHYTCCRARALLKVLEAMGQKPTEEELFQMISEVDDNMSGSIDFPEFLKVYLYKFWEARIGVFCLNYVNILRPSI